MYRLGLLACDFVPDDLSDRFEDYPVMFAAAIASANVDVEWRVYRCYAGELPAQADECDGYITTGSRNGVNDDEAWIADVETFIRELERTKQPLAGICFGHQLIARALGGRVEQSSRGWGIGFKRYKILAKPAWMDSGDDEFTVPACHQDQVMDLPPHAERLASSAHCENFMAQFNDTMIGFQGHPEFNRDYIAVLLEMREDIIEKNTWRTARESLDRSTDNALIMRWIAQFLGIAQSR